MTDRTVAQSAGIVARYVETETERQLRFERDEHTGVIAQHRRGYAMLMVRPTPDGDELERYYGLDMALDHVAALLDVDVHDLPVPAAASDLGM